MSSRAAGSARATTAATVDFPDPAAPATTMTVWLGISVIANGSVGAGGGRTASALLPIAACG